VLLNSHYSAAIYGIPPICDYNSVHHGGCDMYLHPLIISGEPLSH